MTCTGFGATIIEPNVPNCISTHDRILELINKGFPPKQIVLRIDPIIATRDGMSRVEFLLNMFKDTNIKRVRFSFLDLYPYVKQRFNDANIKLPYDSFTAPIQMRKKALEILNRWRYDYELESCAEDTEFKLGCVSQKDLDILGINKKIEVSGFQRKSCLCAAEKTELLNNKYRCKHKCIYCYWKDK